MPPLQCNINGWFVGDAYMRPVDVPPTTPQKQHHPRSLNALQGWFFYHTNYFTKLNGRSLWNAGQRQIKVLEGKPDSVKVRSVFDIR